MTRADGFGEIVFDVSVSGPPETLPDPAGFALLLRSELMPAIEAACAGAPAGLSLPEIAIDLGALPADPDWPAVQADLTARLRAVFLGTTEHAARPESETAAEAGTIPAERGPLTRDRPRRADPGDPGDPPTDAMAPSRLVANAPEGSPRPPGNRAPDAGLNAPIDDGGTGVEPDLRLPSPTPTTSHPAPDAHPHAPGRSTARVEPEVRRTPGVPSPAADHPVATAPDPGISIGDRSARVGPEARRLPDAPRPAPAAPARHEATDLGARVGEGTPRADPEVRRVPAAQSPVSKAATGHKAPDNPDSEPEARHLPGIPPTTPATGSPPTRDLGSPIGTRAAQDEPEPRHLPGIQPTPPTAGSPPTRDLGSPIGTSAARDEPEPRHLPGIQPTPPVAGSPPTRDLGSPVGKSAARDEPEPHHLPGIQPTTPATGSPPTRDLGSPIGNSAARDKPEPHHLPGIQPTTPVAGSPPTRDLGSPVGNSAARDEPEARHLPGIQPTPPTAGSPPLRDVGGPVGSSAARDEPAARHLSGIPPTPPATGSPPTRDLGGPVGNGAAQDEPEARHLPGIPPRRPAAGSPPTPADARDAARDEPEAHHLPGRPSPAPEAGAPDTRDPGAPIASAARIPPEPRHPPGIPAGHDLAAPASGDTGFVDPEVRHPPDLPLSAAGMPETPPHARRPPVPSSAPRTDTGQAAPDIPRGFPDPDRGRGHPPAPDATADPAAPPRANAPTPPIARGDAPHPTPGEAPTPDRTPPPASPGTHDPRTLRALLARPNAPGAAERLHALAAHPSALAALGRLLAGDAALGTRFTAEASAPLVARITRYLTAPPEPPGSDEPPLHQDPLPASGAPPAVSGGVPETPPDPDPTSPGPGATPPEPEPASLLRLLLGAGTTERAGILHRAHRSTAADLLADLLASDGPAEIAALLAAKLRGTAREGSPSPSPARTDGAREARRPRPKAGSPTDPDARDRSPDLAPPPDAAGATTPPSPGANALPDLRTPDPPSARAPGAPPAGRRTEPPVDPGSVLLATWRSDRAGFDRATAGRPAPELLTLLAAVLGRPGGEAPPLLDAARAAAARRPDPAPLLLAVLRGVVAGLPIDLADLATAGEATAAQRPAPDPDAAPPTGPEAPTDAAAPRAPPAPPRPAPAASGQPGAEPTAPHWPAVARILAGAADPDAAAMAAAVAGAPHRVAAEILGAADPAAAIARFVAASDEATRRRLLEHLRPGFAARELVALRILWSALPDPPRHRDRGHGLWRFALGAAAGRLPATGGITGLVAQAIAALAGTDAGRRTLAADALARLGTGARAHPPAALAQVAAGLRHMLGPDAPADAADATDVLVHTRSAGLVLLAPYLPTLFARLDLLDRGRFRDAAAADRALDTLYALAHGSDPPRPDGRPLERLLCAVPSDQPLRPPLPLAPAEAAVADDLLAAVVARWTALGATSVAGLREAFLARDGHLRRTDAGHGLDVAPRAFDMLLDRLPWSYALVKLAWMDRPIHVSWRK